MKNISIIIGTRPNFIKVTRFKELAKQYDVSIRLVHTGQHYDKDMAEVFFTQFGLVPDVFLNVPPMGQIEQIAQMMIGLEKEFLANPPDVVLVPGDVNSTFAAAFVAQRLGIKLGHIESGLRSRDMGMPEEVNRILTDKITDFFFVTEESGRKHLLEEGVAASKIHFVGNTMIDTLLRHEKDIEASNVLESMGIRGDYALMTLHRPSNVDKLEDLHKSLDLIEAIAEKIQLVLALHPRTYKNLEKNKLLDVLQNNPGIYLSGPLPYFDFQKLVAHCRLVITDSGGIQEETTFRKIPCITLRPNTERPVTIDIGSNVLMEMDKQKVCKAVDEVLNKVWKKSVVPPLWDGRATERILQALKTDLN